jgi:outer membrane autotransporter protein
MGQTFLTGVVTAAYQNQDVKRNVLSGGIVVPARGTADAWLAGGGVTLGHVIPIEGAWTITPKADLAYLHAKRDGYTEAGGGLGGISVDGQSTDTVRGDVGGELGLTIRDPNASWTVKPALHAALAHEWRAGDETVSGHFNTGGAAFTAPLDTRDQTYMVAGLGVDVGFGHGISAFATYDTSSGGDAEHSNGFQMGARLEW